jgi:hypothetical protein
MDGQTSLQIDPLVLLDFLSRARAGREYPTYAGIGSRKTPTDVLSLMTECARRLHNWRCRTGAADGADRAFLDGCESKEVYLPWPGFGGYTRCMAALTEPTKRAVEIAREHHPNWHNLTNAAKMLMARNTHQVLGATCDDPSAFVLCWTPDGSVGKTYSRTGGTGQALRIAHAHNIPVFNLQRDDHRRAWEAFAGIR